MKNLPKEIKLAAEKIIECEVWMIKEEITNSELSYKTVVQKEVIFSSTHQTSLKHKFLKQADRLNYSYEIMDTLLKWSN